MRRLALLSLLLAACSSESTWFYRAGPPYPIECFENALPGGIAAKYGKTATEIRKILRICPAWAPALCAQKSANDPCHDNDEKGPPASSAAGGPLG